MTDEMEDLLDLIEQSCSRRTDSKNEAQGITVLLLQQELFPYDAKSHDLRQLARPAFSHLRVLNLRGTVVSWCTFAGCARVLMLNEILV